MAQLKSVPRTRVTIAVSLENEFKSPTSAGGVFLLRLLRPHNLQLRPSPL